MTRVAILTGRYGGYDTLKVQPDLGDGVSWYAFSDQPPALDEVQAISRWRYQVRRFDGVGAHPRLEAKVPKMLPFAVLPGHFDYALWIDASMTIVHPDFVEHMVKAASGGVLAQHVHPLRSCVYDEMEASVPLAKYAGQPCAEQVDAYRAEGFPPHWGLWATGVIAWRNCPEAWALGAAWLAETIRWSYQDQLSEPVVCWRHGVRPEPLDAGLWSNVYVTIAPHAHDR